MKNQKGSAVAIVLILLAAGGLMGAGLMLQSQLNSKVSTAKTSHIRSVNLADWAAQLAYQHLINNQSPVETELSSLNRYTEVVYAAGPDSYGAWASRKTYRGMLESGGAIRGDEEGTREGPSYQAWLAEGIGDRGDGWVEKQGYSQGVRITHRGSTFECTMSHTSVWTNEPGVDYNIKHAATVDWQSVWKVVAPGRTVVQIAVRKRIGGSE